MFKKKIIFLIPIFTIFVLLIFPFKVSAKTVSTSQPYPITNLPPCSPGPEQVSWHATQVWTLSSDKDTVLANGSDTISITYISDVYMNGQEADACSQSIESKVEPAFEYAIYSLDSGVRVQLGNATMSHWGGKWVYTAKVTSTSVGTKTINGGYNSMDGQPSARLSLTLNFISLSSGFSANSGTALDPTTSNATSQKPSAPVISTINGQKLPEDKTYTKTIRQGQPITFSGQTSANSTVKLYVYSDPIATEAKSDGDGNWAYLLEQELAVGDHRVEAEVVDASGKTSDRVEIAKFTVKPKSTPVEIGETQQYIFSGTPILYGLGGGFLLSMGVLIYLIIRRKRKSIINIQPNPVV